MNHRTIVPVLFAWAASALAAAPLVVSLDSGERLVGEESPESTDAVLVLRSRLLGELRLPRGSIVRIEPFDPKAAPGVATADATPPDAKPKPKPKPKPDPATAARAAPVVAAALPPGAEAEEIEEEEPSFVQKLRSFKAPESWNGNLRVGLNLSSGDSNWTETYTKGTLEIRPKDSPNFYRFTGSYTFRETERNNGTRVVSTDRYDGTFIYRRNFRENWFVQNALGGRVDQVKGIDREIQELLGIGYRYEPNTKLELIVGAGGGVEDFEADAEDSRNGLHPVANVFQEFTWKPLERAYIVQKFNYYWDPGDSEYFNYVLTAAVRYRLTDLLGFEFAFDKDFDNDIGGGESKDDTRIRNAIIVYF